MNIFLYSLIEISSPMLDVENVIEYIIDGIPDSQFNKSILYQAANIEDLN